MGKKKVMQTVDEPVMEKVKEPVLDEVIDLPRVQEDRDFDYEAVIPKEHFYNKDGKKLIKLSGLIWLVSAYGYKSKRTEILQVPDPLNEWSSAARVIYIFSDGIECDACADARPATLDDFVANFSTAMAETRANARVIRLYFRIATCSAEEVTDKEFAGTDSPIQDNQRVTIEHMMEKKGISLKDINDIARGNGTSEIESIGLLTKGRSANLIAWLSKQS